MRQRMLHARDRQSPARRRAHCSRTMATQSSSTSRMSIVARRPAPSCRLRSWTGRARRIDHRQQMAAAAQDVAGIIEIALIAQLAEQLAGDDFGKADDGVQRRAQFMAHIGQEAGLGGIGGFGFALGAAQGFLAFLDDGEVGQEDDRAAFGGGAAGHAQPAAIGQFQLGMAARCRCPRRCLAWAQAGSGSGPAPRRSGCRGTS